MGRGTLVGFSGKSSSASAAFVCCNVFRTLCFVTPIVVKEEDEDSLIVRKLNFTLTNTLAYRLLFFLKLLEPPSLPPSLTHDTRDGIFIKISLFSFLAFFVCFLT